MKLQERILQLRSSGKTYNQIVEELECSKSTVSYYCNSGVKQRHLQRISAKKRENWRYRFITRVSNYRLRKIKDVETSTMCTDWNKKFRTAASSFKNRYKDKGTIVTKYTYKEALEHLGGTKVKCYITGIPIDIEVDDYQLDHIIPVSKGGTNDICNMGITLPIINQMKGNLSTEELLHWCRVILEANDYEVIPKKA